VRGAVRVGTPWLSLAAGALFVTRFFVPAESAHLGETLWIVQLWLVVAALGAWASARLGDGRWRWDWGDAAVVLLAAGHVVSALAVVVTGAGQQRAAVNLLWEWIGVSVAVVILRRAWGDGRSAVSIPALIAVACVVLSGLGVWQHHYWYPATRAVLVELESLQGGGAGAGSRRVQELRAELGPLVGLADPAAQAGIRQRLLASSEPIGRFALANTLGGLLAAGLVLLAGVTFDQWRGRAPQAWRLAVSIASVLVMYGLVLTKSRTAWIGAAAGAVAWWLISRRRGGITRRALWWTAGTVVAGIVVLFGFAARSGGFDREVVGEAPKSLQYRLEYWTATWRVIAEHPLLGVGPGNFRQSYLRYKLAGASEEVLDPHNLFLDAWANGGLLALAGLGGVFAFGLRRMCAAEVPPDSKWEPGNRTVNRAARRRLAATGTAAFGLAIAVSYAVDTEIDWQLIALLAGWWACAYVLAQPLGGVDRATIAAAGLALSVHLLGAGGMGMPAIAVPLLLLVLGPLAPLQSRAVASPPGQMLLVCAISLGLCFLCGWTATIPVLTAKAHCDVAKAAVASQQVGGVAERELRAAAKADPLDPEPWELLAGVEFLRWDRGGRTSVETFEQALGHLREAQRRDPQSARYARAAGEWLLERFRATHAPADAEAAVDWLRQAIDRYPQHSAVRAALARALAGAGRAAEAREAAGAALALDDLNRARGHTDKLLDEGTRDELRGLAGDGD
jgi:hypothetical protein